jgi:hypothetical protein
VSAEVSSEVNDHADVSASGLVYLEYLDRNNYTLFNLATLRIAVVRAGLVKHEGLLPTSTTGTGSHKWDTRSQ